VQNVDIVDIVDEVTRKPIFRVKSALSTRSTTSRS